MTRATCLAALAIGWAILQTGALSASADDEKALPAEKLLIKKGLTRDDRKFLFAEDENAVIEKYKQTQELYAEYQAAMKKYAAILQYDQTVQAAESQRQALQMEINSIQMELNNTPLNYNSRMRAMQNAAQAPYRQQQNVDRAAMNQINAQVQAFKQQGPKAEERKAAPADYDRTRKAYIASVKELDELVAPLLGKYHELGQDQAVKDALADIRLRTTQNVKLGPSAQVLAASKVIQHMKSMKALPSSKPASKKKAKSN